MTAYGVCGGCFDPVHLGHLIMAERLRELCGLDSVLFVPSFDPPHRPAVASYDERVALVRSAIADHPAFRVSEIERELETPSYTIRTLEALEGQPVLLLGADALAGLPSWHRAEDVLRTVDIAVASRPGTDDPLAPLREGFGVEALTRIRHFDTPLIAISSTEIRARRASGASVRYLVPEAVRQRLDSRRPYRT